MNNNKSLYFLHIPKTGGTSVNAQIKQSLLNNNIKIYPPSSPPHPYDIEDYKYISGHFGRYPIDRIIDLDVACLFRDPVDRSISTFLYIYNKILFIDNQYVKINNFVDKLKYYLFEDPTYSVHQNLQTQFISNSPIINIYNNLKGKKVLSRSKGINWGIENPILNLDLAKEFVDKMNIIGITPKHDEFTNYLIEWFSSNYKINVLPDQIHKESNKSKVVYEGIEYTTKVLKELLSQEELDLILYLNSIDDQLYQYVCKKIASPK